MAWDLRHGYCNSWDGGCNHTINIGFAEVFIKKIPRHGNTAINLIINHTLNIGFCKILHQFCFSKAWEQSNQSHPPSCGTSNFPMWFEILPWGRLLPPTHPMHTMKDVQVGPQVTHFPTQKESQCQGWFFSSWPIHFPKWPKMRIFLEVSDTKCRKFLIEKSPSYTKFQKGSRQYTRMLFFIKKNPFIGNFVFVFMDHFASQWVMLGQNDHLSWVGNITSFAWKLKHVAKLKKKPKQNKSKHYMILTPFRGCWK